MSVIVGRRIKDKSGPVLVSVAGPIIPILAIRQNIRADLGIIEEKPPDTLRAPCLWELAGILSGSATHILDNTQLSLCGEQLSTFAQNQECP